jgi:hypothetical protein
VLLELDGALARNEPDFEVQDLVKASAGLNLGLDYLPGSVAFSTLDLVKVDPLLASRVVWFDAYMSNVDRTARNTNMLYWHRRLTLIDHGAALYFHHGTNDYLARSRDLFKPIKDHVLLPAASELVEAARLSRSALTLAALDAVINELPVAWLEQEEQRLAYRAYLQARLEAADLFVEEAQHARAQFI